MRTYAALPAIPDAGVLHRYADTLGVIVPVARVNLVPNPSVETTTDGYSVLSGAAIARTADAQYVGAYGLRVTPGTGTSSGVEYQGLAALTAGTTYAISVFLRGVAGKSYALTVRSLGAQTLASTTITATGGWQRPVLIYTEASGAVRHIGITKAGGAETTPYYLDGLQVEACGSEGVFVTTYLDGDQRGLVPHETPAAYLWDGAPHASTSRRSAQTRAGGRVVRFRDAGFLLTQIIGLEQPTPDHELLTFTQGDGAQYQDTTLPPRPFTLVGRWAATSPQALDVGASALARLLGRDTVDRRQPLLLTLQSEDCGAAGGALVTVPALSTGGLEGQTADLPTAAAALSFVQPQPVVWGGDGGAALDALAVLDVAGVGRRTPGGGWDDVAGGVNGEVSALARGADGVIFVGGDFTQAGGSAAARLAGYNPLSDTWSLLFAGVFNGAVSALAVAPTGELAVGGLFTNGGGVAAADYLARRTVPLGIWSSYGATPPNGAVTALRWVVVNGALWLVAGGFFSNVGGAGARYIAAWDGSAWQALGAGTELNNSVNALATTPDGSLYVGGSFTTLSGVAQRGIARYDLATGGWYAVPAVNGTVYALAAAPDGTVYAGGDFTTAGGLTVNRVARWTGARWEALGSGVNAGVYALAIAPDGSLLVGGMFTQAGGVAAPGGVARWTGAVWLPLDINLGGATTYALLAPPDGGLYVGGTYGGTATAAGVATATNAGTAAAHPRLVLDGPTSGVARIDRVANETTGAAIAFTGLYLAAGERAVLTLDPTNLTFESTLQGNLRRTIAPGSQVTRFTLQPGANTITLFATNNTVTAALTWRTAYRGLSDALDGRAL